MTQIKDLNTLLGLIDNGRSIREVNDLYPKVMAALLAFSEEQTKKTFKGNITLKVSFAVTNGIADVSLDIATKVPTPVRGSSLFWINKNGFLTDEHPKQIPMFGDNARVIEGDRPTDVTAATG